MWHRWYLYVYGLICIFAGVVARLKRLDDFLLTEGRADVLRHAFADLPCEVSLAQSGELCRHLIHTPYVSGRVYQMPQEAFVFAELIES